MRIRRPAVFVVSGDLRFQNSCMGCLYAVTSSTLRSQMRSFFFSQRAQGSNTSSYPETNEFAETHADAAKVCTMTPSGCQTPCSTHCDWAGLLLLQTFGMPCTNGSHSHSQETCCMGFELPSCPLPWLRRPRQLYLVEACTGEPSNHTSRDSVIYVETKQHACRESMERKENPNA